MADNEFRHISVQDRDSITRYLKALVEGFESGHLEFGSEGQSLVLEPIGLVDLEIKAKRKSGRSKVSLKFTWRDTEQSDGSGPGSLSIRSGNDE